MDEAAIVAALRANPDLLAHLTQAVAAPTPHQPQDVQMTSPVCDVEHHPRSLTLGRSSDPARPGEDKERGRSTHRHTHSLPRGASGASGRSSRDDSEVPYEPAQLLYPRKATITPPRSPVQHPLHHHAPTRETSPGDGPWPFSRDGHPHPPLLSSSDNANTAGPVVDEHPYDHPYYETPTSYEEQTTNNGCRARGGCARNQDGSLKETFIELLGDRKSKFDYTAAHTHPFATLHSLSHYNPYSAIKADKEFYDRVPKPKGLAGGPGRGGETKLHEELGLQMDMPFYNKVFRGAVKQALHKFVPKNLEPGAKITWNRYSVAAQRQCYELVPAFQHFRDQTGEDCWAVALIAQQYLQGKTKLPALDNEGATSRKAAQDLRPNLEEYEDDYTTNAPAYHAGSKAPNPCAAPADTLRPRPAPTNAPRARSANPPRGQAADRTPTPVQAPVAGPSHARPTSTVPHAQDNPQTTSSSRSSRDDGLPPASTERQNRKADKLTTAEEARAKAKAQVQAQVAKGQGQPSMLACAKGKQTVHPPRQDESEDDEEATCQFAKKVKAGPRTHVRIMSPDSETEPALTAGSKKGKASQAAKALAKAVTRATTKTPAKHKADEDSAAEDEETQAPKAPNKRGKTSETTQATKRKAEEELMVEDEEPRKEIEEPQSKKRKIQPRMRPPPASDPEPEPEPPSTSLPANTPASQPAEDAIQISSSDPPEPGSSRAPIAVNSSDPPSGMVGTISDSGHRVIGISMMKIPRTKKAPLPPSDRVFRERKK